MVAKRNASSNILHLECSISFFRITPSHDSLYTTEDSDFTISNRTLFGSHATEHRLLFSPTSQTSRSRSTIEHCLHPALCHGCRRSAFSTGRLPTSTHNSMWHQEFRILRAMQQAPSTKRLHENFVTFSVDHRKSARAPTTEPSNRHRRRRRPRGPGRFKFFKAQTAT